MSTGAIIAIVAGAVVVVLLFALVISAIARSRRAAHREQAAELREDARSRSIDAASTRAAADEQAAHAKRVQAEAEERAAQARHGRATAERSAVEAEHETQAAREQHDRARALDPDVSDSPHEEALAMDEVPEGDAPREPVNADRAR